MTTWFTADTHFKHHNIIEYCNRPFKDVDTHDITLIQNWNEKVQKDDTIYHLGDFAFGSANGWMEIISQLNGNINLIKGNHDHRDKLKKLKAIPGKKMSFIGHYHELKIKDEEMDVTQIIVLCHYPIESWNKRHHSSWHLHGHCHGTILSPDHQSRLDVGVDCCNFRPISYNEVKIIMTRKVFKSIDHHGTPLGSTVGRNKS